MVSSFNGRVRGGKALAAASCTIGGIHDHDTRTSTCFPGRPVTLQQLTTDCRGLLLPAALLGSFSSRVFLYIFP